MAKDYYKILGVSKNAAKEEIKKAYKELAKKYHPDLHKGDKEKEEKFKELNEANLVLSDDKARANYDRFGAADFSNGSSYGTGTDFAGFDFSSGFDFDVDDIFSNFFGGSTRRSRSRKRRGSDLRYNLDITLEEAAFGAEKTFEVNKYETCDKCSGTGAKKSSDVVVCPDCNGSGHVQRSQRTPFGIITTSMTCRKCKGAGQYVKDICSECDGKGSVRKKKKISIKIPAGIDTGNSLRVAGEGEVGIDGADSGDLYVVINVKEHSVFERRGDNIYCDVPLTFVQAALGADIEVPTLEGKAKLKIPAGTQTNTIFRMRNKGISSLDGYGTGDENVRVVVQVPEKLTKQQKELLEQFDSESSEAKHRKGWFR